MKVTIDQLIRSLGSPELGDAGAFNRFLSNPLPIKTSLRMKELVRAVNTKVQDYHDARIEACQRHGTLNEQTGQYEFKDGKREKFNAEFAELLSAEITLPGDRLRISQLLSSTTITPADLITLEWLIDDGTPVEQVNAKADADAQNTASNEADDQAQAESDAEEALDVNEVAPGVQRPEDVLDLGEDLAAAASV